MAHDYADLKRALAEVAEDFGPESFETNPELRKANEAAVELFTQDGPVLRRTEPQGPLRNITAISLGKVNNYLRRNGLDWPLLSWADLIEFLKKNWFKILRLLLNLLLLVL